ncbi:MAG: WXG100 family type VII secretion target [Lachnospiraceae bacterium]
MATLKVTPAKLKSTATALQSTGSQVKSLTAQMTTLVSSLSGNVWSGDAATAYTKKFKKLDDDISKMKKMIDEHVKDLQTIASQYEKTENANKAAANALSSDVIV